LRILVLASFFKDFHDAKNRIIKSIHSAYFFVPFAFHKSQPNPN
jgi:hypothetical protein